ncbi:MAG: HEAT repeat domain-containing protein [Gemmataceae bacterium]
MSAPLLVEFFTALPEDARQGGLDRPTTVSIDEPSPGGPPARTGGKARRRAAIHVFCKQVQQRYLEGTLLRLLESDDPVARRAAVFALGLLGSPAANDALAERLRDEDEAVARSATEALWTLWFRGDSPAHADQLYRSLRTRDGEKALAALDALIAKAPRFAEAYNQRAILHFRLERYDRAAADCEAVLRLNPKHFGAQAGLGQCLLRLRRQRAALRAFRIALRINPHLDSVAAMVRTLENQPGEEGR